MVATRNDTKILVGRAIDRTVADRYFRERYNRMTANVKCRPGGRRRNQLFDQVAAGNNTPWAQVLEAIDLVIDEANAPESDVLPFARAFMDYVEGKYRSREVQQVAPTEALRLCIHSDAEEEKAVADALAEPSVGNYMKAIDAIAADTRCNALSIEVLNQRVRDAQLRIAR